jgi:hypothetical protein
MIQRSMEAARNSVTAEVASAAWKPGWTMTFEQAIAEAAEQGL